MSLRNENFFSPNQVSVPHFLIPGAERHLQRFWIPLIVGNWHKVFFPICYLSVSLSFYLFSHSLFLYPLSICKFYLILSLSLFLVSSNSLRTSSIFPSMFLFSSLSLSEFLFFIFALSLSIMDDDALKYPLFNSRLNLQVKLFLNMFLLHTVTHGKNLTKTN